MTARAFLATARATRGARTVAVAPHVVAVAEASTAEARDLADAIDATARDLAGAPVREDRGVSAIDAPFASALALSSSWRTSVARGERLLVSAPSRDAILFVTGAHDDLVRRLADRAERAYHAANDPVSPAIYEASSRGLAPFHADGASANATALGHALLAMSEYEAQRAALAVDARADVAVAECQLVLRRGDDRPLTVATWGERVATLLPYVDFVVLAGGDPRTGWRFAIAWDRLERAVGPCWQRAGDLVPPRVRTIAWPDRDALRALYDARDSLLVATAAPP